MPPKVPFPDLCMHILFALMQIHKEKKQHFCICNSIDRLIALGFIQAFLQFTVTLQTHSSSLTWQHTEEGTAEAVAHGVGA